MQSAAAVHRDALATPAGEPLFSSAHAALTFAFNHTMQAYDAPTMVQILNDARGNGKGLGGLDGAAQAGFIKAKVGQLSRLHQHIIQARFLPQTTACPCCNSGVWDHNWLAAVRVVSDCVMESGVLSGHIVHRAVRDGIVARYFASKENRKRLLLGSVADNAGVSDRTVTDQNGKITLWLRGSRLTKVSGGYGAGKKGEEARAMEAIEDLLTSAGMVE